MGYVRWLEVLVVGLPAHRVARDRELSAQASARRSMPLHHVVRLSLCQKVVGFLARLLPALRLQSRRPRVSTLIIRTDVSRTAVALGPTWAV